MKIEKLKFSKSNFPDDISIVYENQLEMMNKINDLIDAHNSKEEEVEIKEGNKYWYIDSFTEVTWDGWTSSVCDKYRKAKNNVFKTQEEAIKARGEELKNLGLE